MKLTFKFLEKEEWSMFGTLNTFIPLILTIITKQKVDLKNMILSSVISMMDGNLLPKILFTGFMNFMLMEETKNWVIQSFIYVVSVIIIHQIKYNNFIHKFSYQNEFIKSILILLIILWMIRIFDIIFIKSNKIVKKIFKH